MIRTRFVCRRLLPGLLFVACLTLLSPVAADVMLPGGALLPTQPERWGDQPISAASSRQSASSLLVRLEEGVETRTVARSLSQQGLGVKRHQTFPQYLSVSLPQYLPLETAQAHLTALPGVVSATPHLMLNQLGMPNDPVFHMIEPETGIPYQYHLYYVNAPQAWELQKGSSSVVIAIIDSGISAHHVDLAANIVPGWDFAGTNVGWMNHPEYPYDDEWDPIGDSNPSVWDPAWGQPGDKSPAYPVFEEDDWWLPLSDWEYTAQWWASNYDPAIGDIVDNDFSWEGMSWDEGVNHGTLVAGIAGAVTDNAEGLAGMAYNCSLMPLRIINAEGWGWGIDAAEAIIYAADHGVDVINCSWGFGPIWSIPEQYFEEGGEAWLVQEAIKYAHSKGCIIIAASGNSADHPYFPDYHERGGGLDFPANMPETISVGAIDWEYERAYYSSYANTDLGEVLDLVAPGDMAFSTGLIRPYDWYMSTMLFDVQYPLGYDTYEQTPGGTSFTAPVVAGFAGLLRSRYSYITAEQFREYIWASAMDLGEPGYDRYYGYGMLDAYAAIVYTDIHIPEPTTAALIGLGVAALVGRARLRRAARRGRGDRGPG